MRPSASVRAVLIGFSMFLASSTLLVPDARAALPYQDPRLPVDARVQDLLSRMTPDGEVLAALHARPAVSENGPGGTPTAPSASRSRRLRTAQDPADATSTASSVTSSRRRASASRSSSSARRSTDWSRRTRPSFPQAIGLAATFDTDLMGEVAGAIAEECRAAAIRQVLSPVVNIATDVRWGRVEETYGEDPFLASEMGVAFVSAFERRGS